MINCYIQLPILRMTVSMLVYVYKKRGIHSLPMSNRASPNALTITG